jgi:23S rRNA (cytidine1920-2'-O)/16S rRNA (cytidine1409-2'-O)-methyltransferase
MRLDVFLSENGLASTRSEAKALICGGAVIVNGKAVSKPAFDVCENDSISIDTDMKKYASRGGLKLEAALDAFNVRPTGKLALDVGASSGGFTDCLLKRGALRVVAVDSGIGQLADFLRNDERVVSIEKFNARFMQPSDLPFVPEIAVMDVSFISAKLIIPRVYECLAPTGDYVCLIKPQFEVGREGIGKGGIVKDEKLRNRAVAEVIEFAERCGFCFLGAIKSPITGKDGNIEFLAHFRKEV